VIWPPEEFWQGEGAPAPLADLVLQTGRPYCDPNRSVGRCANSKIPADSSREKNGRFWKQSDKGGIMADTYALGLPTTVVGDIVRRETVVPDEENHVDLTSGSRWDELAIAAARYLRNSPYRDLASLHEHERDLLRDKNTERTQPSQLSPKAPEVSPTAYLPLFAYQSPMMEEVAV
jgi:hypothetical protein